MSNIIKFTSEITDKITLILDDLRRVKPEKEFSISVSEGNMYWCVNWKTDRCLKEYFQVQIWNNNTKYYLMGEHRVEDVFEHFSEEYFIHEELIPKDLFQIADKIIQQIKEGVLEAVDKEFDTSY